MISGRSRSSSRAIIACLVFAGMCASFMQTLVLPIQADLPQIFDAPRAATAWAVTATLFSACVVYPVSGRLGDLYGRKRVAVVLIGCLVTGSVICACASTLPMLIAGRALQGFVMGVIPLSIAILRNVLPAERLVGGITTVSATMGIGGAIGLPLSAFVADQWHWSWLFWASAMLGVVVGVLMLWIVPHVPSARTEGFDVVGAVGLILGLFALLFALSQVGAGSVMVPWVIGSAVLGVLCLAAWVRWELRSRSPLVDLRTNARSAVLFTNLSAFAIGVAFYAGNVALPQVLQLPAGTPGAIGMGLPLAITGLVLMPGAILPLVLSPVTTWFARAWGGRALIIVGPLVVAAGLVIGTFAHTSVWHVAVVYALLSLGIAVSFSGMPMIIMEAVPGPDIGSANSINSLARSIGTSTSAALVGAILAAFTTDVSGREVPTHGGLMTVFVICIAFALLSAALAMIVPGPGRAVGRVVEPAPPVL